MKLKIRLFGSFVVAALVLAMATVSSSAADAQTVGAASAVTDKESSAEKQRELIRMLKSNAPPEEKAIACKRLAIYGGKEAVPALAPLLSDADLASWARIA